jgi:hypothetical protein
MKYFQSGKSADWQSHVIHQLLPSFGKGHAEQPGHAIMLTLTATQLRTGKPPWYPAIQ